MHRNSVLIDMVLTVMYIRHCVWYVLLVLLVISDSLLLQRILVITLTLAAGNARIRTESHALTCQNCCLARH